MINNDRTDICLYAYRNYYSLKERITIHNYADLGNNRAVVNGNTGEFKQTIAYYPFGGVIADLGFGQDRQQCKLGSKGLITANGLNQIYFVLR